MSHAKQFYIHAASAVEAVNAARETNINPETGACRHTIRRIDVRQAPRTFWQWLFRRPSRQWRVEIEFVDDDWQQLSRIIDSPFVDITSHYNVPEGVRLETDGYDIIETIGDQRKVITLFDPFPYSLISGID